MALDQSSSIRVGWDVVTSDGKGIGKVEEVHDDYLLVRGGTLFKHDLYVPVAACARAGDGNVTLDVASNDVDDSGWRFPPDRGFGGQHKVPTTAGDPTMTTMTGAGYGAGGGVAAAGPLAPGRGDAIADRLGGSSRAGLSAADTSATDDLERGIAPTDPRDELHDDGDTGDDTSDDTSEDTSTDTSGDAAASDAPPLT